MNTKQNAIQPIQYSGDSVGKRYFPVPAFMVQWCIVVHKGVKNHRDCHLISLHSHM